jgi:hypothetical protein
LAGQEIIVGPNDGSVDAIIKSDGLARRRVVTDVQGIYTISRCEFSPLSVLAKNNIVSSLLNSKENTDRALSAKLMKMAACLMQATASHGAYSTAR